MAKNKMKYKKTIDPRINAEVLAHLCSTDQALLFKLEGKMFYGKREPTEEDIQFWLKFLEQGLPHNSQE